MTTTLIPLPSLTPSSIILINGKSIIVDNTINYYKVSSKHNLGDVLFSNPVCKYNANSFRPHSSVKPQLVSWDPCFMPSFNEKSCWVINPLGGMVILKSNEISLPIKSVLFDFCSRYKP